jgi:TonB family protein
MVVGHELAHVARGDWFVQVIAEAVRAWHWFNPLAWAIGARLRQESEQACDDVVLEGGYDGVAYAEHLVTIARELRATRQWLPALSMAQASGFERRIRMLITPVNRRPVSRLATLAVVMAALAITVPLAGAAAQAVAKVTGSVADPQSGLLPGVAMVLTSTATNERREIRSDGSGRFEFASLEPGDYVLEAKLPGFDAFTSRMTVTNGTIQQNLKLDIGVVQETITVRSSRSRAEPASAPAPPDQEAFRRLEEIKRQRAAQRCTTEPVRSGPFIGGNIRVPIKVNDVRPAYPETMRANGRSGTVMLNARISKDGLLDDLIVVSSTDPAFSDAAIQAVSRWEFDATLLNCMAVDTRFAARVQFDLEP